MGIYGLEFLNCGCKIKHYKGGKTITYTHHSCNLHVNEITYVCIVCKKSMLKKQLKDHRWSHAI